MSATANRIAHDDTGARVPVSCWLRPWLCQHVELFYVGLFSALDVILEVDMGQALDTLPLGRIRKRLLTIGGLGAAWPACWPWSWRRHCC